MLITDPKENFMNIQDFKPKISEHLEQASFFSWLLTFKEREHPEIHPLFFSVANGVHLAGTGRQRAIQMNKLKAEGFTPGVTDTLFLSGRGGYLGLALEFKTVDKKNHRNGGVTEPQAEFLEAARLEGYRAEIAYGADDAERIVNDYLGRPKTQELVYKALRALEDGKPDEAIRILQEVTLVW